MAQRKGPAVGTGGKGRKALTGRGPTPRAEDRPKHPAAKRAAGAARRAAGASPPRAARTGREASRAPAAAGRSSESTGAAAGRSSGSAGAGRGPARGGRATEEPQDELVTGRNAVAEALRARVPASTLLVAVGIDADDRVTEIVALAHKRQLEILELPRPELDRLTGRAPHQGIALRVPPYAYLHPDDLLGRALGAPLLVALDSVTDPHNLGSVIRSTAAFGGHGVVVPERRAAGVTASAWKASAGAAARIPVARAVNLTRTLTSYQKAGLQVIGLAADGDADLDTFPGGDEGLVIVVGSEGKGLSRLVGETCDALVSIPMSGAVESLNAGVAAAVALAEVSRRRRVAAAASR